MRLANLHGRLVLVGPAGAVDVATASGGRFGPEPQSIFSAWPEFADWLASCRSEADPTSPAATALDAVPDPTDPTGLGPPVPCPRQVFAVGLNYGERASAAGEAPPVMPPVFPKFPTCLTGPAAAVTVPDDANLDYEVELVVVMARTARNVSAGDAWSYVAGLMLGQDLSDRRAQFRPPVPQFGLSKSRAGFGPTGPWLVTLDELADPDDLAITCSVNGEPRQRDRTRNMLMPVSELIAQLSQVLPLLPGDLIFTGTPGGVGHYLDPPRYLVPGDVLTSEIEQLGTQRITFIGPGLGRSG